MEHIDFSKIFHQSSKNLSKGHLPIPKDSSQWPAAWKTQQYKTYPRLPKIVLFDEKPQADFFNLITRRHSGREYRKKSLSLRELSLLLKYSCGVVSTSENGSARRAHPSGGARYSVEIYLVVPVSGDDVPAGVYHYDVKHHWLDVLWRRTFAEEDISKLFLGDFASGASAMLVMTSVFARNQCKYGERGYRLILLEAGHIGQNVYLASEALGLQCCGLGGTIDDALEELLDIDGSTESVVYALVLGK